MNAFDHAIQRNARTARRFEHHPEPRYVPDHADSIDRILSAVGWIVAVAIAAEVLRIYFGG